MCGIAGFFGGRIVDPAVPARMLDEIRRRGPDAQHSLLWDARFRPAGSEVANALLHTRLSIIDPRPEADQPMSNDAGDVWISYNGEVFDWQADADALRREGVVFRTRSDTEYILRAYEARGMDFLPRLRGMFAFAIVDLRRSRVLLVRDRMGVKPLVYAHHDGELAFGSTVRAVLPYLPEARRGFSADAIDAYLAHRYVPAPRTIFGAVSRLENGHYLEFDLATRQLAKHRYWHPQPASGDWRATLDHAVKIRTVADRPLGIFLSSGVDSSVLACRLAEQGFHDLHTFTAAFPGSDMDEAPEAKAFADAVGLPHHAIPVPQAIAGDFERIVADLDEPFADPSAFPMWYLSRATVEHVKVVLGGDGGDELFAGYKRYGQHLRSAWRRGLRIPGLGLRPTLDGRGAAKIATEAGLDWREAYSLRFSGFTPGQRMYLQPGRSPAPATYWRLGDDPGADPGTGPLETLLAIDMDNYFPEYILRKGDLCTMAHGLELRTPLLDHLWYQCLLALPRERRFTTPAKRLLAEACAPCEAMGLFTRRKRGFNPPLQQWLREDLAARLAGVGERLERSTDGQLAAGAVAAMVDHYLRGARHMAEQILQLLVLDESLRQLRGPVLRPPG
jgi:asparagine synthase (glutamine-hydrolysing)